MPWSGFSHRKRSAPRAPRPLAAQSTLFFSWEREGLGVGADCVAFLWRRAVSPADFFLSHL